MTADATTEARFRRLEMEVRRMRWVSAGALTLVGVVCLTSMQSKPANDIVADTVTVKKLRVVDDDGHVRAELWLDGRRGPEENAVALSMWAPDHIREHVRLRAGASGGELVLSKGSSSACMEAVDGSAAFLLFNGGKKSDSNSVVAKIEAKNSIGSLELVHDVLDEPTSESLTMQRLGQVSLTPCEGVRIR